MTRRERVLRALRREPLDRFPAGELHIEPGLCGRILGKEVSTDYHSFERDVAVRNALNADLVDVGDWPSWPTGEYKDGYPCYENVYGCTYYSTGASRHILRPMFEDPEDAETYPVPDISKVDPSLVTKYARETDFFVFAQIGGPISMLDESLEFEDFLVYSLTDTESMCLVAEKIMEFEIAKAKLFIDAGADGILLADDMAYNSGTFLSPEIMDKLAFPFYRRAVREIKAYKDVPVVLHTDGNLNAVMDRILACGFDGLQSLQPSAGMDIYKLKKDVGDRITLWGNLDLDYLMTNGTPEEVGTEARKLMDAMGDTGFILSTCNTLIDPIPTENALRLYGTDRSIRK